MRLYLVQHGEATSEEVDPNRPLTERGRQDVARTAESLRSAGIKIDIILHSTKTRAIETAQILAKALLPKEGTKQRKDLAPNDPVDKLFNELTTENRDLMIVGHLPFLGKLASLALVGSESSEIVGFRQGGVICLERREGKIWQLVFALTPDLPGCS